MRNAIEAISVQLCKNLLDIYAPEEIALTNYKKSAFILHTLLRNCINSHKLPEDEP